MNDHETTVCEHGTQISTCRCPADNKAIVVTPNCPYGCEQAGVTALSPGQIYQLRNYLQSEAADELNEIARTGLQLLIRLDRERIDEINRKYREESDARMAAEREAQK